MVMDGKYNGNRSIKLSYAMDSARFIKLKKMILILFKANKYHPYFILFLLSA